MSNHFISPSEFIVNPDGSVYHLQLKPSEVAPKIITVGDPMRVKKVTRHFGKIEFERENREFFSSTGIFKGERITVISTGIGTDNVDIVLNELDALFQVNFDKRVLKEKFTPLKIMRIGTSGAMQTDIPLDSFVASKMALSFDALLPFYTEKNFESPQNWPAKLSAIAPRVTAGSEILLNHIPGEIKTGITATMPGFYAPQGRSFRLQSIFKNQLQALRDLKIEGQRVTNLEMETAGIYGLSTLLGHEAISLNAILANRINGEFSAQPEKSIDNLIELGLDYFKSV